MYTKPHPSRRSRSAFTLLELMVAGGLGLVVSASVVFSFIFSSKAELLTSNYATLNQKSELALNKLTRDLRAMNRVTSYALTENTSSTYSSSSRVITQVTLAPRAGASSNEWLQLEYSPSLRCLVRRSGGNSQILLRDCDFLEFNFFQRTLTNGTFSSIPTTNSSLAKMVQLRWACSRWGGPSRQQTEVNQSAKVVMRTR